MKVLRNLAKSAGAALMGMAGEPPTEVEAAKRAGLYVHRPVLNAKAWNKWATDFGVPSPVPAEEMHVTIVNSVTNVVMRPDTQVYQFDTDRAYICLLGLKEDALVVCFQSWILMDRFYDFCEAGATSSFPTQP